MGKIKFLIIIILIGILSCCKNKSNSTIEIGKGKDVIVTLEIQDNTGIDKIVFQANGSNELILSENLSMQSIVKYGFDGKGEGTFNICIYTKTDTICSEHYVEGGYRPILKYADNCIVVDNHTGIGY